MPDDEKRPLFFERRHFQGTVAVVGLFSAILAIVGAPKLWNVVSDLFAGGAPPTSYTEVVLDTSASMGGPFHGNETMLQAAAHEIGESVKELTNEGLGLRRTARTCEGRSERLISLGKEHTDEVTAAAQQQRPEGRSNIVDAVIGALQDFQTPDIQSRPPSSRRLLVFTTAVNECRKRSVAQELENAISAKEISARSSLAVFALQPSAGEQSQLEALERVLGNHVTIYPAQTPEDLEEATNAVNSEYEQRAREEEQNEEAGPSLAE